MRRARKPHRVCGPMRTGSHARTGIGRLRAALPALGLAIYALLAASPVAIAQDPSIKAQTGSTASSFPTTPGGMFGNTPKVNATLPLNLQADQLIYDTKGQKVIARGNVEVYYNNNVLTADEVIYDQAASLLTAKGNVILRDANGNIGRTDFLQLTDDFRDAFAESLSVVSKDETRIAARRVTRRDGNVTEYEQGKFTPCRNDPGQPPLWCISAARIVHDQQAATIQYQDAKFELLGVPIFALPYFEHADPSVKRKSGFLAPHFGTSTTLGFRFEMPYYFALSPSYDFTFNPEYLSKQGVLWKGEFRQKLANGQYFVRGAVINQDSNRLPGGSDPALDGWRGTLESRGVFSLSSWWKAGWDITLESDKSFRRFYGLDSVLQTDRVNTLYLTGMSERNYFNTQLYHFGGLLLDDSATSTARVHPVIDYNYILGNTVLGGELSFSGHARSMSRPNATELATTTVGKTAFVGTDTTHLVADVSWRRKIIDSIGQTFTPFFSVRGDSFSYRDTRDPVTGQQAPNDSLLFGVGTAALTYAYPFVAHTGTASHVVEPIVQVVSRHMNKPDQRLLPNEDAKSLNFNEGLLFDVSKTSGYDRVDTGTRLNTGVQYSFQATNGFHARAIFGQSFHLSGQNVFANPGQDVTSTAAPGVFPSAFSANSGLQDNRSDYVAGLYVSPLRNFSFVTQARFDDRDWSLRRLDTLVSGSFGPLTAQAIYTNTSSDSLSANTQQELQFVLGLKLTDFWSVVGQVRYDIDAKRMVQDSIGLRYQDECFVLTGTYSDNSIENATLGIKPDKTFMLRFELKNLGDFNYRTDVTNFLNRGDNQPTSGAN